MEVRKVKCLYHPNEVITNFCRDKNCLMPLCPSCIGDHTLAHEQVKSKPSYFNIYQVLSEVQNGLYNIIYSLEEDKKRNISIMKKISAVDDFVHEKIVQVKNLVMNIIQQTFKEIQVEVKKELEKMHEQIGVYCLKKSKSHQEKLTQYIEECFNINESLKTDKYLGTIIIFLKEKHQQYKKYHQKTQSYLQANQSYYPRLEINNDSKNSMINSMNRLLKIQSKKDVVNRKQKKYVQNSKILQNKPLNEYEDKTQKIQRSYTPQKSKGKASNEESYIVKPFPAVNNSIYRDRSSSIIGEKYPHQSHSNFQIKSRTNETSRIKDFKQQYQILSRKISQMRQENESILKYYK